MQLNCRCYWTSLPPVLNGYPPCNFSNECRGDMIIVFQNNQSKFFDMFVSECPLECDQMKFNTQMSSQAYPSREMYELFKKTSTDYDIYTNDLNLNVSSYSEYKKYFFKINVFYESMDYTLVTLSPKLTLINLLSNLGGTIGAFLGFTLFTFLEAFEMFIQIIYILIFKY